ncbi:hypothetical protein [Candidatus Albibeggiatoa sp. nov. BB20]|uniref:hypothetical protein n=1 Tax=Candidatus Albibeggiatoa sp. nov. BB20 TaxID=3162723 RepID=UPI00336548BD
MTSSTMFTNLQVTVARMFTYSAAGIQPNRWQRFYCYAVDWNGFSYFGLESYL